MVFETFAEGLRASFQNLLSGVINFLPELVTAIIIVIVGWFVAHLLGGVVAQLIRALRVDEALRKAGIDDVLRRGGIGLNSGKFIGTLVKWFIILVFLVATFDVLGLDTINQFLNDVVLLYIPQVIVAVLILLVAAVIGDVMKRVVVTSAKSAELRSAHLLGSVTKWAIWIFAILVALDQLGIAEGFVQTLFTGFVVALSLGVGLAFGLGGQATAARIVEKTWSEVSHND